MGKRFEQGDLDGISVDVAQIDIELAVLGLSAIIEKRAEGACTTICACFHTGLKGQHVQAFGRLSFYFGLFFADTDTVR